MWNVPFWSVSSGKWQVFSPQCTVTGQSRAWVWTHLYSFLSQVVKSVKLTDYSQNNISKNDKSSFSSHKMCFWEGNDSWSDARTDITIARRNGICNLWLSKPLTALWARAACLGAGNVEHNNLCCLSFPLWICLEVLSSASCDMSGRKKKWWKGEKILLQSV